MSSKSLLLLLLLGVCGPRAGAASDWPQFLGPTRNGVYGGPALAASLPKEGPKVVWQKKVGQGFSGPVVAGDKAILFHRLEDKETVDCLDAATGAALWRFDYTTTYQDDFGFDEGPRSTPCVAEGRVYTMGAAGMIHCLDLATGKKVWSVDAKADFGARKGFFGMVCSPLAEGPNILLNIGGADGAGIVAFDKLTGKVRWKSTSDEASYSSPVAANIGGARRAFFFNRAGLVVLDPASGEVKTEFPWKPRISSSVSAATPLVIGDLVFLSASYGAGAVVLKCEDRKLSKLWSGDDILSNHYATSVQAGGALYGFDGRQEQRAALTCVDLKTGKVHWREERFGSGSITVAGDQFVILTENGEIILAPVSTAGFKPTHRSQLLPFLARAYPALANGFLYARSKDKLVCADLR